MYCITYTDPTIRRYIVEEVVLTGYDVDVDTSALCRGGHAAVVACVCRQGARNVQS